MSDKTTKQVNNKYKGLSKPGHTNNPGGRPKINKDLVTRCKDMTDKVLNTLSSILDTGKPMEQIKAGEIILAYGNGKPTQRTEVTGADGGPVETVNLFDPDKRAEILKRWEALK